MRGGYQEKVKNSKIYKKTFSRVTFLGTSKDPSQKAGKLIYIFSERTYPNLAKLAMVHGLVSNRLSFCIAALHASQFYSCSDQSLVFTNLEAVQVGGHLDSDRSTKVDRIWTVGSFQSCQWSTVIPGAWPWHATGSFHFKAVRPSSSSIYPPQPTDFLSGAWQWSWAQRLSPDYPISNEPIICRNLFALMVLICLIFFLIWHF